MRFTLTDDRPFPDRVEALTEPAYLLVWSLRAWVTGHRDPGSGTMDWVWRVHSVRFGASDARAGLRALEHLVDGLCRGARRPFQFNPPCCARLTVHEARLVALVKACQEDREATAALQAEWLVTVEGRARLIQAARAIGAVMTWHGHHLASGGPARVTPFASRSDGWDQEDTRDGTEQSGDDRMAPQSRTTNTEQRECRTTRAEFGPSR